MPNTNPGTDRAQLGFEIRRRRIDAGMTQIELAREAPCSRPMLQLLEGGLVPERSAVLPRVLAALSRAEGGRT